MIRLVDDFLLVTKSATVATQFYNIMSGGVVFECMRVCASVCVCVCVCVCMCLSAY